MKFLLLYIWQLSKKLQQKLVAYIKTKLKRTSSDLNHKSESPPVAKFKKIRKKKSFHSFLREQQSSLSQINHSKIKRYIRRKEDRSLRVLQQQKLISLRNYLSQPIKTQNIQRDIVMSCQPENIEQALIFNDKNGLQISFIAQIHPIQEEISDNYSQSDSQILKFVYGSELCNNMAQKAQKKSQENLQWWQKLLDKNISSSSLEISLIKNIQIDDFNPEEQLKGKKIQKDSLNVSNNVRKFSKGNKVYTQSRKRLVMPHLCVINMIDLVSDEDQPKLFQVPLSME